MALRSNFGSSAPAFGREEGMFLLLIPRVPLRFTLG